MRKALISAAVGAGLWSMPIHASLASDVHIGPVTDYVKANVLPWIGDPIIIETLKDRNELHAHFTATDLDNMDAVWRTEFSSKSRPLIESVLSNPLSTFLRDRQAAAGGVITEIFVIDAKGLSVGESEISSDYWQGDELKWQKTYLLGSGALFVDQAEKDESTQMLQSQASLTISDPRTGQPIGAITVGINLDAL